MAIETNPFEAERAALMGYFQSVFIDQDGALDDDGDPKPFLFVAQTPNRRFDQPDAGPFVNVSVQGGNPFNRMASGTATRAVGYFTVEVYVPENTGSKDGRRVAGLMEKNYHNFRLVIPTGIIRFWEIGCRDVPSGMDGFGKTNVEIMYWSDTNQSGQMDPLFGNPDNAERGYIVLAPGAPPVQAPSTLGLAVASNAALDASGNLVLRNSTTTAFNYLVMQGVPGAEAIVGLDNYAGGQVNVKTDADGNLMLFNETTNGYLYPFVRGAAGAAAVVASAQWTLPGRNWTKDSIGNLLLRNVTTSVFQQVSFQGAAGAQTLQPIIPP